METQLEQLVSDAMKLSSNERAALAQLLLASLDPSAVDDDALERDVERRVADVDSGLTPVIPMADALAQIRARLK
jgi:putative addiction module component (TIGR02574 family)